MCGIPTEADAARRPLKRVAGRVRERYAHPRPPSHVPGDGTGGVSPAPHADGATTTQQAHGKSVSCASNINWAGNDPALATQDLSGYASWAISGP